MQMSRSQLWNIALITARSGEHRLAVELLLRFIKAPHDVGGAPVDIKGDPLLEVVRFLLEDGLQNPWPATLATLASRELWGTKETVVSPADLIEALNDHMANADDPFRVGAQVLMYTKPAEPGAQPSWEAATVKRTRTSNKNTFDLVNWRTHMNIDASKVRVASRYAFCLRRPCFPVHAALFSSCTRLSPSPFHLLASSSPHLFISGDRAVEQRPQFRNARGREDRRCKHHPMHAQRQSRHLQLR